MTSRGWLVTASFAALVLIIWAVREWPVDTSSGADEATTSVPTAADPVADFQNVARQPLGAAGRADADAIANGLRTLAGALDSLDIGGDELPEDLRIAAAHVLLRPDGLDVAELVQELAIRTATALKTVDGNGTLSAAARSVTASTPLPDQAESLQSFFTAAATDIERAAGRTGP